eukprot:3236390-Pyramimonas_sp.AAC.1
MVFAPWPGGGTAPRRRGRRRTPRGGARFVARLVVSRLLLRYHGIAGCSRGPKRRRLYLGYACDFMLDIRLQRMHS